MELLCLYTGTIISIFVHTEDTKVALAYLRTSVLDARVISRISPLLAMSMKSEFNVCFSYSSWIFCLTFRLDYEFSYQRFVLTEDIVQILTDRRNSTAVVDSSTGRHTPEVSVRTAGEHTWSRQHVACCRGEPRRAVVSLEGAW